MLEAALKILIDDGARMYRQTGYGALSRSIFRSLASIDEHQIFRLNHHASYDKDIAYQDKLDDIPIAKVSEVDAVLRIASPGKIPIYDKPTIIYTQHALSSLPPQFVHNLKKCDAVIVPGEFDRQVFSKDLSKVYVCPQHVDEKIFRPITKWRSEGSTEFTFLFVGSYSYRKGIDHMWNVFRTAFSNESKLINLRVHCFNGLTGENLSRFVNEIRSIPKNVKLTCTSGNLTAAWMNRLYNQVDCVFTFSRGEGWCMPLHEGLLCHKPIIAPNSTAMGEALPKNGVRLVKTVPTEIATLTEPFAISHKKAYGIRDAHHWDIDLDDAVAAVHEVHSNYEQFKQQAKIGAKVINREYSLQNMGKRLANIFSDFEANRTID